MWTTFSLKYLALPFLTFVNFLAKIFYTEFFRTPLTIIRGVIIKNLIFLTFLFASCATADNFADVIMPDEFGIGNSFLNGNYRGRGLSNGSDGGFDRWAEGGELGGNITSAWFVWKLPSFGDNDVSVRKLRENYVKDTYEEPEGSIISVEVDPETGSKSYRFGPGFYGAMLTIITLLGLGAAKLKGLFGGDNSTDPPSIE